MSTADTCDGAHIDNDTEARLVGLLQAMGLSILDAIRLLMLRVADQLRLPFAVKAPNAATRSAMADREADNGRRFDSVEPLRWPQNRKKHRNPERAVLLCVSQSC